MKKIILLKIFIFFLFQTLVAQSEYRFDGDILSNYKMNYSPSAQSPDVTAFQKVTEIPVDNYTGRAQVSIPIYTISSGNIKIPITLDYNTSGVKVADMPSNVGTNWSLNAGGVTTKNVKGLDDFTVPEGIHSASGLINEYTPSGWLISALGYTYSEDQQNDPLPDIYNMNAPGLSTKFIHDKVINGNTEPIEIEKNGNIINDSFGLVYSGSAVIGGTNIPLNSYGLTSLEITSLDGMIYNFNAPEVILTHTDSQDLNNPANFLKGTNFQTNAYKLSSIFDPSTNKNIIFNYEDYTTNFHDEFEVSQNEFNYVVNIKSQRLTEIQFDNGSVNFIYGLNRIDNPDEKALTEIIIKNHLDNIVEHYVLEYGYFQSPIAPLSPQSKRLKLQKVYRVDSNLQSGVGKYEFSYNESVIMPPRDSWAHDFLGYNNGSYNSSLQTPIPKIYERNNAINNNYSYSQTDDGNLGRLYIPFNQSGTTMVSGGNYSLEANENYSKAYILNEIKFPTGGKQVIEYELNNFQKYGFHYGGGLRIKTLKIIDEYENEIIKDYSYGNGKIKDLPIYTKLSPYLKLYNTPQNNVELTNGSFVGYEWVNITNRYDKESTRYHYFTHDDYPDIPSSKTIFGSSSTNRSLARTWRAKARYSLELDRDILRGKLQKKLIVDKNGLYKLKQSYNYLLKEFETINYTFQNPTDDPLLYGCYTEDGLYMRHCGGYDEEIFFPIERNLLISIKTQVLEDFHEETDFTQGVYAEYFETEKRYWYDSDYPRIVAEVQGTDLCDYELILNDPQAQDFCNNENLKFIRKEYEYPLSGSILHQEHRLNTPISTVTINEFGELKSENFNYNLFNGNLAALKSINLTTNNHLSTDLLPKISPEITQIDSKGNVIEVISESDIYTTFIFGYGSRYLICKLENVSISELESAATNLNINLNDLKNSNNDIEIRNKTNELRNYLTNARVTSYTNIPLVGLNSITDERGISTFFEYDSFNRLIFTKDNNQNLISEYEYNTKN